MNKLNWLFVGVFLVLFLSASFAANMNASVNGDFYTTGTLFFNGDVDPNLSSGSYTVAVNVYDKNSLLTNPLVHSANLTTDVNGIFSQAWNDFNEADYNVVFTEATNSLTSTMNFTVSAIAYTDINFLNNVYPPFSLNQQFQFNLQPKTVNGIDVNGYADLNVLLVSESGSIRDSNQAVKQRADSNRTYDINFTASAIGNNYLLIKKGNIPLQSFGIPTYSYVVFADLFDDQNSLKDSFGPNTIVYIKIKVTDFNGSTLYLIDNYSVDVNVLLPSGSVQQLTATSYGGQYIATYTPTTAGNYSVKVAVSSSGVTQKTSRSFSVKSYSLNIMPKKNVNAGKKEKMPGVYGLDVNATFSVSFINLSNGKPLLTSSLGSSACNKSNYLIKYKKVSEVAFTAVSAGDINVGSAENGCDLNINTPSSAGTYVFEINGKDLNLSNSLNSFTVTTTLVVQNYVIFMDAVDPSTFSQDPKNSGKFDFFKDENVGFKPTVIDFNADMHSRVIAVTGMRIMTPSGLVNVASTHFTYNADTNLLNIDGNAFSDANISDGFLPIEFTVNVDSNGTVFDVNGVTAFGGIKYKSMSISVVLYTKKAGAMAVKTQDMGPGAYRANEEEVWLRVTAKDGSDQAIKYATVTLTKLTNMETFQAVTLSGLNTISGITNNSGVFNLNLGPLSSGGYFGELSVIKGSSIGKGQTFFVVKKYMVFGMPILYNATDDSCQEFSQIGTTSDFNLLLMVFVPDPQEAQMGMTQIADYTVSNSDFRLIKEGGLEEFKEPTFVDISADNWTFGTAPSACANLNFPPGALDFNLNIITVHKPVDFNWEPGYYRVGITTNSASYGIDSGVGFYMVSKFSFKVLPVGISNKQRGLDEQAGEAVSPGSWFDFNVFSGADVTIQVALAKEDDFMELSGATNLDVNHGINPLAGTVQCAEVTCNTDNDVNADTMTTLKVKIPAGTQTDNYLLIVTATNASGDSSESELFLQVKNFKLLIPTIYNLEFRQNSTRTAYDTNAWNDINMENGDQPQWYPAFDYNSEITYTRWIATNIQLNGGSTINDWNRFVLVNTLNDTMWIDWNAADDVYADGNFLNDYGPYSKATYLPALSDGNIPIVFDIATRTSNSQLRYIALPKSDVNSNNDRWAGTYDADTNFYVPVLIKTMADVAVSGADVNILKVFRMVPGMGMPQEITEGTDWNTTGSTSDANGLAFPQLVIGKTGNYMIQVYVKSGSSEQYFMPWDGPMFAVNKYDAKSWLTTNTTVTIDNNISIASLRGIYSHDLNTSLTIDPDGPGPSTDKNYYFDDNIGVFNETDRGYDLDADGSLDENWYFLRVKPEFRQFSSFDINLIVDDDLNFWLALGNQGKLLDYNENPINGGLWTTELGHSNEAIFASPGSGGCIGDYNTLVTANDPYLNYENDCITYEALWDFHENDTNVVDNNTQLYKLIDYRYDVFGLDAQNSWAVWIDKNQGFNASTDTNAYALVKVRNENQQLVLINGTATAQLIKRVMMPQGFEDFRPVGSVQTASITNGIARINLGTLSSLDANTKYSAELTLTLGANQQNVFMEFWSR
ncbi:MAG: hypothetical protein COT15_01910 [Candidatus Diapherotrites archaeon CG08_land_8_20_14_0_20_34_12]|nr:MAG: hypothetical protein COT15_01910 [Candidatus Diapherotrites archaeon CG08_land_8_20_14_0_20_34_12]